MIHLPNRELREEEQVPGLGGFSIAMSGIERNVELLSGLRIARARDIAAGRTYCDSFDSRLSEHWSFSREGVIYLPHESFCIFVAESPLLKDAGTAAKLHLAEKEYPIDPAPYLELAKQDSGLPPENRRAILYPVGATVNSFSTSSFAEFPILRFIWGEAAEAYGAFMTRHGADSLQLYLLRQAYVQSISSPFIRQLWIGCSDARSPIQADWTFSEFDRLRAISEAA